MLNTESAARQIDFFKLLRATEGLTQRRPLIAGFSTILVAILLGYVSGHLVTMFDNDTLQKAVSLLGVVAVLVVLAAGFSAVGALLMDQAKSIPQRSMSDAFVFGLMCLPRFLGFGLLLLLLAVVVLLVAAVVYFICKIPGIGPLLFFVSHPVLVVASGVLFIAVVWVGIPLIAPAIWEGRTLKESLSVLLAAAKHRLLVVVLTLFALYLVVGVVSSLVGSVLFSGYLSMSGLAAGILGAEVLSGGASQMTSFLPGLGGGMGYYNDGGGYMYAGLAATGLIFSVAAALLAQVLIMGFNLVYLITIDGLDVNSSQAALDKRLADIKQKAQDAQERARQAADRAKQNQAVSQQAATTPQPAPAAQTIVPPQTSFDSVCPNCQAKITAGDLFCEECGHKLKD